MLWNKTVYFQKIYVFYIDQFVIRVIFLVYQWKLLLNIKNSRSKQNYAEYGKMLRNKIVYLKKIYKFISDTFSVFVLDVENFI